MNRNYLTIVEEAQFLLERIDELDWSLLSDEQGEFFREWDGHVEPSLSRLKIAFENIKSEQAI